MAVVVLSGLRPVQSSHLDLVRGYAVHRRRRLRPVVGVTGAMPIHQRAVLGRSAPPGVSLLQLRVESTCNQFYRDQ
jgi:hypothetical protein